MDYATYSQLLQILTAILNFHLYVVKADTELNELPGWQKEVVNGDHFDEICVSSNKRLFSTNVLLVMYADACAKTLKKQIQPHTKHFPPENFMLYVTYNYDQARKGAFMDMDEDIDLKLRYGKETECLDILLFKRGQPKNDVPFRYRFKSKVPILEWLWKILEIRVGFANKLKTPVTVEFNHVAHAYKAFTPIDVESGELKIVISYPSYIAVIIAKEDKKSKNPELVQSKILKSDINITISKPFKKSHSVRQYVQDTRKLQQLEVEKYAKWLTNHTRRNILLIKQPQLLNVLARTGFQVTKYSKDLFQNLIKFYKSENKKGKEVICNEHIMALDSMKQDLYCSKYKLEATLKRQIKSEAKEIGEEYCDCDLQTIDISEMIVYPKGYLLHRDVKFPEKAGVTVILHLMHHKEENNEVGWVTELTTNDGGKVNVDLDIQEALVYESAKIPFGRPEPLNHAAYVDIIVSMKPLRSWPFKSPDIIKYINMGVSRGRRVGLIKRKFKPFKDETLPIDSEEAVKVADAEQVKTRKDQVTEKESFGKEKDSIYINKANLDEINYVNNKMPDKSEIKFTDATHSKQDVDQSKYSRSDTVDVPGKQEATEYSRSDTVDVSDKQEATEYSRSDTVDVTDKQEATEYSRSDTVDVPDKQEATEYSRSDTVDVPDKQEATEYSKSDKVDVSEKQKATDMENEDVAREQQNKIEEIYEETLDAEHVNQDSKYTSVEAHTEEYDTENLLHETGQKEDKVVDKGCDQNVEKLPEHAEDVEQSSECFSENEKPNDFPHQSNQLPATKYFTENSKTIEQSEDETSQPIEYVIQKSEQYYDYSDKKTNSDIQETNSTKRNELNNENKGEHHTHDEL